MKGKGHEFSDVAKLLNYYQLWLDQLYPRAKFADAIQLVEKAGHTKRMQMYRKSWIDEGKPGFVRREEAYRAVDGQDAERPDDSHVALSDEQQEEEEEDPATLFFDTGKLQDAADDAGPDEDELEALMAQEGEGPARLPTTPKPAEDSEGEDDLDALLVQAEERGSKQFAAHNEADEHEIDALLNAPTTTFDKAPRQQSDPAAPQTVDGEDDELDELLNDDSQHTFDHAVENEREESKDFPGDDIDEFDALISGPGATYEPELPPVLATAQTMNDKIQQSSTSEAMPELDNAISSSQECRYGIGHQHCVLYSYTKREILSGEPWLSKSSAKLPTFHDLKPVDKLLTIVSSFLHASSPWQS